MFYGVYAFFRTTTTLTANRGYQDRQALSFPLTTRSIKIRSGLLYRPGTEILFIRTVSFVRRIELGSNISKLGPIDLVSNLRVTAETSVMGAHESKVEEKRSLYR